MSLRKLTGYRLIPAKNITINRMYHYEKMKKRQSTALLIQPEQDELDNVLIYRHVICLSSLQDKYRNTSYGVYLRVVSLG